MASAVASIKTNLQIDLKSDTMSIDNTVQKISHVGPRQVQAFIYSDGTQWIPLQDKGKERFCGFLYLQKFLTENSFTAIKPAANKMAIYKGRIIYLSQYCGEDRPKFLKLSEQIEKEYLSFAKESGFVDRTNSRIKDDKMYVFDTEKNSFEEESHIKIDSFAQLHGTIRLSLLTSVNKIFAI